MKEKPTSKLPKGTQPAKSLAQVLNESKLVKEMVKESADELALVNVVLNEEFSNQKRMPEVEMALDKFKTINDSYGHDAGIVARKVIKAVQMPCNVSAGELTVNTSIGISIFPKDGTTAEALIKSADAAMYRAKQSQSGYAFASDDSVPPG